MYEAFYGLNSKPFQLNPDPSFYFGSKQHRRAKAYLEYGLLRNEGFIVITGEIGAGKTTIVRGLLDSMDVNTVTAANLVSTQLDAEDTLRMVGAAFGVRVKDVSKADLLMALEAFLVTQVSEGKRSLLIVDEAQNLTPRAVEELRMLSNFQFGKQALLQTFLVGQPEFREILQHPNMQQLRQRVTATCHIGPLDVEETQGYIEHRLKCAGSTGKNPSSAHGTFEGHLQGHGWNSAAHQLGLRQAAAVGLSWATRSRCRWKMLRKLSTNCMTRAEVVLAGIRLRVRRWSRHPVLTHPIRWWISIWPNCRALRITAMSFPVN